MGAIDFKTNIGLFAPMGRSYGKPIIGNGFCFPSRPGTGMLVI
jgi:hypothetical protein